MVLAAGCDSGPRTARVTGVITIDGEPVPNASIAFYPENGRASVGTTDANGKYELVYTNNRKGALLGEHVVTISTEIVNVTDYAADDSYEGENPDADPGAEESAPQSRDEFLPARYRERESSELTAVVNGGENVIDFPLTSR